MQPRPDKIQQFSFWNSFVLRVHALACSAGGDILTTRERDRPRSVGRAAGVIRPTFEAFHHTDQSNHPRAFDGGQECGYIFANQSRHI